MEQSGAKEAAKMGFSGTSYHGLDPKNRIFIPVNHRADLGDSFQIFRAEENCLRLYPNHIWDVISAQANALTADRENNTLENRREARKIFGKVDECKMDKQGRITLAAHQLSYSNITQEVAIIGMGDYIEVWNADAWREFMGDE